MVFSIPVVFSQQRAEHVKGGKFNDYFISEVKRGVNIEIQKFIHDFKAQGPTKNSTTDGVGAS